MKKTLLLVYLLSTLFFAQGQDGKKKFVYLGFSGGMSIHSGYISGPALMGQKMRGFPSGIGGKLSFHFSKNIRFGLEGYATSLRYGDHKSTYKIGWGGILVDYAYEIGKFTPFVGLTIGGGSAKNMILLAPIDHSFTPIQAVYRESPLFIINPSIGCEFSVSKKIRLLLKADYMLSPTKEADFATGLRLYFGVIFNKLG